MSNRNRPVVASLTILVLLLWIAPAPALSSGGSGRLEGMVLDTSGRAASGYAVHLIDAEGHSFARALASDEGIYSFKDLPAGEYALGIENRDGQFAPVSSPPVKVGKDQLARRDLKLVAADGATVNREAEANYGLGMWWSGLTPAAKTWTVVAIVVIGGITWAAFDENNASPADLVPQ
jgi:predicted alpha/beta hydrolase